MIYELISKLRPALFFYSLFLAILSSSCSNHINDKGIKFEIDNKGIIINEKEYPDYSLMECKVCNKSSKENINYRIYRTKIRFTTYPSAFDLALYRALSDIETMIIPDGITMIIKEYCHDIEDSLLVIEIGDMVHTLLRTKQAYYEDTDHLPLSRDTLFLHNISNTDHWIGIMPLGSFLVPLFQPISRISGHLVNEPLDKTMIITNSVLLDQFVDRGVATASLNYHIIPAPKAVLLKSEVSLPNNRELTLLRYDSPQEDPIQTIVPLFLTSNYDEEDLANELYITKEKYPTCGQYIIKTQNFMILNSELILMKNDSSFVIFHNFKNIPTTFFCSTEREQVNFNSSTYELYGSEEHYVYYQ